MPCLNMTKSFNSYFFILNDSWADGLKQYHHTNRKLKMQINYNNIFINLLTCQMKKDLKYQSKCHIANIEIKNVNHKEHLKWTLA